MKPWSNTGMTAVSGRTDRSVDVHRAAHRTPRRAGSDRRWRRRIPARFPRIDRSLAQAVRSPPHARAQQPADAGRRSPDHRGDRHPVDRADGECRPAGGGGDGGGVRGSCEQPGRRAVRPRQQRRRRLRRRAHPDPARRRRRRVPARQRVRGHRRRAHQPRDPRPHRPHRRRDHQRAGVGAALHRDHRVRPRWWTRSSAPASVAS